MTLRITQRLSAAQPLQASDFGIDVATDGETLLVGAPAEEDYAGAVYFFARSGASWMLQTRLAGPCPASTGGIGMRLAVSGATAVLGGSAGACLVVREGNRWVYGDALGYAGGVAIEGDVLAVGPEIFTRVGGTLAHRSTLSASAAGEHVQRVAAIHGRALAANGEPAGARFDYPAYVFELDSASEWRLTSTIENAISYAFSNDLLAVSSKAGTDTETKVTFFSRLGGGWNESGQISAQPDDIGFAERIALSADLLVAMSTGATWPHTNLRLFLRDGAWTELPRPMYQAQPIRIYSIAAAGRTIVAGGKWRNADTVYTMRVASELGSPCVSADDCHSGFCADSVCCDGACGNGAVDDCQACSEAAGAAATGSCGPVEPSRVCRAAGDECDVEDRCDGLSLFCPADRRLPPGHACGQGECTAVGCAAPAPHDGGLDGAPVDGGGDVAPSPANDGCNFAPARPSWPLAANAVGAIALCSRRRRKRRTA